MGIDEWSPQEGMAEYECDSYPCSSDNVQGRATSPPEIILGVLNYGNVWTQGIDMAFTQVLSEKMFFNGNFSWYNTTEFFNELTRRNDPINAPKFKWNLNFNYKNDDWENALREACPNGIDCYFDNVGGDILDSITKQLNLYGKIIMCGLMSQYNRSDASEWHGHNMGPFVGKRANLLGLVVYDYYDQISDFINVVGPLVAEGKVKFFEDRANKLEYAPEHFVKLMNGKNVGKSMVTIAPERI